MSKVQGYVGTIYGITNKMLEPEVNHLASEFIVDNYDKLILAAKKMGVDPSLCYDIVQDVYVSIQHSEANGRGYDPNKGNASDYISLEEFVFGRLKGYSWNKKYRVANADSCTEIAASSDSGELDEMNQYQKAYEMAGNYDDIEAIDLSLSVGEELEYTLKFEKELKMNIRYFLKHLSEIAHMNVEVSVFKELRKMCTNQEFMEALRALTDYAKSSPEKYEALVANI